MALAIHTLRLPSELHVGLSLSIKVATGAALFPAILATLWWMAGQPGGFEMMVFGQIKNLIGRPKADR